MPKKQETTIGLYMIVKDELESVTELLQDAEPYFDYIYLTVSDKKTYTALKSLEDNQIKVDYRKWNDRFDDARNHNFSRGVTTYKMWLDADDSFDFRTIPKLKQLLDNNETDVIWLPYEYAYDDNGNCIALHWRERIIRGGLGFTWRGWVHENYLSEQSFRSKRVNIPVKHTNSDKDKSTERNIKILEKAYAETNDPRYVHYLGITYFSMGRMEEAIDILKEYVSVGGWDEEVYRSLLRMSEASNILNRTEDAMQYVLRAAGLLPDYPDAFFNLAQLEFEQNNYKQTLEWLKVAFSKTRPESASIEDPTVADRAKLMGAMAEYELKNYRQAVELLKQVKTTDTSEILPEFEYQASIDRVSSILPALIKHYKDPKFLWEGLNEETKYDPRFRRLREKLTEPKTWDTGTIVFFCGKGYEEWGPHTLDKGMGGSEEAVVYLSRELAKQGFNVTVLGEVKESFYDLEKNKQWVQDDMALVGETGKYALPTVVWKPWTHIDKRDHFDTLIVWRYPQFASQFKANKMFVDMHDLLPQKYVVPYKDVTYLFKSQWHKDQYPQIEDYKVIGNGIDLGHFND